MDFLSWHYSSGINYYLKQWRYALGWIVHYFSITFLLKSLFAPWKRLYIEENVGWNLEKAFSNMMFNFVSRGVGLVVRLILIWAGVFLLGVVGGLGAVGVGIWIVLPFLGLPAYLNQKKNQEKQNIGAEAKKFISEHLTEGYSKEDEAAVINWWKEKIDREVRARDRDRGYGRPGIGLELLFGYTPNLNNYVTDLSVRQDFSHHLIGREEIVSRIERMLQSSKSVYLSGQPGVGKRTVVLEFARRAVKGELGSDLSYRRVLEFDYNFLFSESTDLNKKKTRFADLLAEAARAGNIILVIRDIHRITNSAVEGFDFTDIFEKYLEAGNLKIIAVTSSIEYERFITTNQRLNKYFGLVEVRVPSLTEARSIIFSAVEEIEKQKKIRILYQAVERILTGSDRYISETPFPEKALELLDEVVVLARNQGVKVIGADLVDQVLSEKTGISFSQLTETSKEKLANLENLLHKRLVGQNLAVSLIARSLRASSVGAKGENRPIGSFLFLGPTGVGKTQTAKVLAEVYFGSASILRFDMAEYAGAEGLSRLIGSVASNQPGVLTTEIKNHPASLLLLDEIEKAPREILNLLLALLDEGMITDAFGRKVNCKHLFVIATSNAGSEHIRQMVSRGVGGEELQENLLEYVQNQGLFSPEFLNRFDGIVVYEPISQEDLPKVARMQLEDLQKNLKLKNIELEITPEACQKVAQDGYAPAFGARPMRRVVELVIGDVLGKGILAGEIKEGDKIKIVPGEGKEEYTVEKLKN